MLGAEVAVAAEHRAVDGVLSPPQLVLVVLAIEPERRALLDRQPEPRLAERCRRLELLRQQALPGPAVAIEPRDHADWNPILDDPLP